MLRQIALVWALGVLVLAEPAAAEPREFTAAGKWKHDESGIKLPESIGIMRRGRMVEYGGPANISAAYQDTSTSTTFTVYLYPSASGSVPVWFNEARKALAANKDLGKTASEGDIHAFVPPGRNEASGLIESLSVEGNARSTGVAMFEANGHLIKVRATSSKLAPSDLESAMTAFLTGIAWPKPLQGDIKLQPVQDCSAAMAAAEAQLQLAPMVAVLISSGAAKAAADKTGAPPIYCRDPINAELNVYRPGGAGDRYLLPLGDSGNALVVGRDDMMAIMAKADPKNGEPGYWVQLYSANEIAGVEHFSSLPSPDQAAKALSQSVPYYRVVSRGKKTEIAITAERVPAE
jgi:hypothetical protein